MKKSGYCLVNTARSSLVDGWGPHISKGYFVTDTQDTPFNYSYVPGVSQYSCGVRAAEDHELVRVRLAGTPLLKDAFATIEQYILGEGLPIQSVCAFEMRSPEQFTEAGFAEFNEAYISQLNKWNILIGSNNPVARSNVIPDASSLSGPSVHSFTFVRPRKGAPASLVVSGSGEVPEGKKNYYEHIIAPGDDSPAGIKAKSDYVIAEMEWRLGALGSSWAEVTDVQVYTFHPYHSAHARLAHSVPTSANITWQYSAPPIEGLDFEMDCRKVSLEKVIPA